MPLRSLAVATCVIAAVPALWAQPPTPASGRQPAKAPASAPSPSAPQPATLHIGDKAPPLAVTHWFTTLPTTQLTPGKVYVIAFWSCRSPESERTLSHLASLRHGPVDGDCIAIHDASDPASSDDVARFVDKHRASLHFSIGLDELHATTSAWMNAAGRTALPTVFVIGRDLHLAYIGPPQ
jgi:hypothetical protein